MKTGGECQILNLDPFPAEMFPRARISLAARTAFASTPTIAVCSPVVNIPPELPCLSSPDE